MRACSWLPVWLVISATSLRLSQRKEVEFQVEQANQPPQQRQGASKRAELRDQQRGSIKQIKNAGLSSVFPKRMDSAMKKTKTSMNWQGFPTSCVAHIIMHL